MKSKIASYFFSALKSGKRYFSSLACGVKAVNQIIVKQQADLQELFARYHVTQGDIAECKRLSIETPMNIIDAAHYVALKKSISNGESMNISTEEINENPLV